MAKAIPCGYGHKIVDGDSIMYTSQYALCADISGLYKQLAKAEEMLSELLSIPVEQLSEDIFDISGCNMMREAFESVLRKQGKDAYIPTITETVFEHTLSKLKE